MIMYLWSLYVYKYFSRLGYKWEIEFLSNSGCGDMQVNNDNTCMECGYRRSSQILGGGGERRHQG